MSLRKNDNPESGLSVPQGLLALAILDAVAAAVFSSLRS